MTQGFGGFLLLGAARGFCCGVGCKAGGDPGFRCVLLCLQIIVLNSVKTKSTLSLCTKSL